MELNFNRKTAASILFGAALLLLVANMVLSTVMDKTDSESEKIIISSSEIDSLFRFSLASFNIQEDWISLNKRLRNIKSYKVKVPPDLSIPVILAEINSNFWDKEVSVYSEEKEFSGKTLLEISTHDIIKLRSEFYYDDKIKRLTGSFAFILENYQLTGKEDSLLLEIPEAFSTLLIPSTESVRIGKYVADKNKTYSILLNDNIDELKYKLNPDYSNNRLKGSLVSLISDFSKAVFFFIDDESDLFNSSAFKFISDELKKRNISVVKLSVLKKLDSTNRSTLISAFDNIVKDIRENESKIFLLNQADFLKLLPEIKRYKKIGYTVQHPSEVKFE